jgi:ribosome maturation factor RimP
MHVAHEKLIGLDRDRVLAVVGPVLSAHGVEGVELVWRTDQGGWLLQLTIERPDSRIPGAGITVELCGEISRDLSAALDVADVIPQRYRLEVGSPGIERALYTERDYERFAGQLAKLKLREPNEQGQYVLRGTLQGLDDDHNVVLDTERGLLTINPGAIQSGQLVFDWKAGGPQNKPKGKKKPRRQAAGQGK